MMPISHVYVTTKVLNRQSPLLVFGTVLPDIASTSGKKIPRDKIHDAPKEFYEFVNSKYPQLGDLAVGVKLHGGVLKGADYYSDDPEAGFALKEGKKIKHLVSDLLQIENEEVNLKFAHNFIEAGVELNLIKAYPEYMKLYERSVSQVNLGEIAGCISEFTGVDRYLISSELVKYLYWLDLNNLSSTEQLTKGLIIPMISIRLGVEVEANKVIDILNISVEMMRETAMRYLDTAVTGMKNNSELAG